MATLFDPNLGLCIDGHVLLAEIGRGGMGAAYLATHQALSHSKCVIKLVLAEIARHPQGIMRIQLEAEALSRLNKHDHIVKLQNFGVLADGQFYLRFEFIEGVTLQRYVIDQGGLLPLRKAAHLVFQVCNAMDFAHRLGIIHRDLKPDNLMIEFSPPGSTLKERVKVLDFGIAKVVAGVVDPTGSGVVVGTARFMAPEQATNAAAVSGKADVFSLGQILYLLLTGKMPWGIPESDIAIYYKQRTEAPAWPPEELVPPAVARVIMRCLSLNPDDRPTMRELAMELAAAFEGGTEILEKVVPDWVASSSPDATTLPRSAVADPTVSPAAVMAEGRDHVSFPLVAAPAVAQPPPAVTANARPSALAASLASATSATFGPSVDAPLPPVRSAQLLQAVPVGNATASPAWTPPPTPIIAALPTGLVSQRFDAAEPPPEAREPPIAVAAEINLATGTLGPQPYAHADLPAVMVSTTQLPEATPLPRATAAPLPGQPELPPMIAHHAAPHPTSRRALIAALAGALAILAFASFAIVQGGFHKTGEPEATRSTAPSATASGFTALAPADAGVAVTERVGNGSSEHLTDPDHASLTSVTTLLDAGTVASPSFTGNKTPGPHQMSAAQEASQAAAHSPAPAAPQAVTATAAVLHGTLHVEVDPWADVTINGQRKTYTTPVTIRLPVGHYRLVLTKGSSQTATVEVAIKPNETTTVKRSW